MLDILTYPLTRDSFGVEVWMRERPSSYMVNETHLLAKEKCYGI